MTKFLKAIQSTCTPQVMAAIALGFAAFIVPEILSAQYYNGPGIVGGLADARAVGGVADGNIRDIILGILLQVLLFMGLAAFVVIVIAGIWLILSVGDESAKEKAKKIILYAIAGLILIALAAAIVLLVINSTGDASIFGDVPNLSGEGDPDDIRVIVLRILTEVLLFMGLAAVVVIVIAGIMLVFSLGDESAKDKAKKIILYAIAGLVIIAIAAGIVLLIINATGLGEEVFGTVPDLGGTGGNDIRTTVRELLIGVLNFMALAAVVVIVIAGILLVVSLGDEQAKDRAKRIILYAVIGLLVILFARAIVGFISQLVEP